MPEPRVPRFAAMPVQFDSTQRTREHATAYQKKYRQKIRSDAIPGAPKHDSRGTWPVQIRNGLPVKFRAVTDTLPCGCIRRFVPAFMDWELATMCRGHHA